MKHLYLLFSVLLVATVKGVPSPSELQETISQVSQRLLGSQIQESTHYIPPFLQWEKIQGLFPSYIHMNFHGGPPLALVRDRVSFFDNNMFVTNWILQALLEISQINTTFVEENPLLFALETLVQFQDHNLPSDTPIYTFWKQIEVTANGTTFWKAWPTNIADPLQSELSFAQVFENLLRFLGLGNIIPKIDPILEKFPNLFLTAFTIPSDVDDSSVNLALGALLQETSQYFPNCHALWEKMNPNISKAIDIYVEYTYRPFSSDFDRNSIDPRTFYWLRGFLYQEQKLQNDPWLFTTWTQEISQELEHTNIGSAMPYHCNNVDATVSANAIFGISKTVVTAVQLSQQVPSWFQGDIQKVLLDTSRLLQWGIKSGMILQRPDLALLYYPPITDFMWFVSRTVFLLSNVNFSLPSPLDQVLTVLTDAMENEGTQQILSLSSTDGTYTFWDDFLGVNDTDIFGRPLNRAEDRLFTTSVAVNALLDTWTLQSSNVRKWKSSTPNSVVSSVESAVDFLNDYILDNTFARENAFFSGSQKGLDTLPFKYPANFQMFLNRTLLEPNPPQSAIFNLINVVSGLIDEDLYEIELTQTHFNFTTPLVFKGYNREISDTFPYWSSPSFTDATVMLALAKFSTVVVSGK